MLNQKGQAALIDSIIFLTIVMSIATGLLFFTVNYGLTSQDQLQSFYSSDFAADALKVVTYINVVRDGTNIDEIEYENSEDIELDYLLALIKEDYADKKELSGTTINAIKNTFSAALQPFDNAIDYAFYLFNEDESEYLFLLMAVHECKSGCNDPGLPKEIERLFYYCKPGTTNYLEYEVFPTVGKVDSAFGKITLQDEDNIDSIGRPFIMGLQVWIVRDSIALSSLSLNPELDCCIVGQDCEGTI